MPPRIETSMSGGVVNHLRMMRQSLVSTDQYLRRNNGSEGWRIIHSPVSEYEEEFSELLTPGLTIQDLVNEKKAVKSTVKVLDLMSYGYAVASLQDIDGGLSIGLTDNEGDVRETSVSSFHRGNVVDPQTWRFIGRWLHEKFPTDPFFDFVLARPVGGYGSVSVDDANIYRYLMRKTYRYLSSDFGDAFIQIPGLFIPMNPLKGRPWVQGINQNRPLSVEQSSGLDSFSKIMYEWCGVMNDIPGVSLQVGMNRRSRYHLHLTKTHRAPQYMPELIGRDVSFRSEVMS